MLTEEAIRRTLYANRVVSLAVANPHGPFGLEQLAAAVAVHRAATPTPPSTDRVLRPIELLVQTWEKLHALAASSQAGASPVTVGELVAAIIEQYVTDTTS